MSLIVSPNSLQSSTFPFAIHSSQLQPHSAMASASASSEATHDPNVLRFDPTQKKFGTKDRGPGSPGGGSDAHEELQ
ncbi:hypothetical protein ACFX2I_007168 [Malus domestica]